MVSGPTIGPPALYAAGFQARVRKDQAKIMDGTLYVTKKDGRVLRKMGKLRPLKHWVAML